jgi:hypothetical protein
MKSLSLFCSLFKKVAFLVVGCALLVLFALPLHAQDTFSYPLFPTSATGGLQRNGSATIVTTESSNFLRLTPNQGGQVGSAWYTNPAGGTSAPPTAVPLPLASGFSTTFSLQFSNQGGNTGTNGVAGADGIAFVVQNGTFNGYHGDTSGGATAVGPSSSSGGQLGFTGLTNSMAVQFDTYCNSIYGDTCAKNDPYSSADQITVESCGSAANTVNHVANPPCSFGTVDLSTKTSPTIYLADGNQHTVIILYVAPTTTSETNCPPGSASGAAGCGSLSITVDTQVVLTVPFNLAYLGLDSNGDAYAGFTASTGGSWEDQDVTGWNFGVNVTQPFNLTGQTNANFSTTTNGVTTDNELSIDSSTATDAPLVCYNSSNDLNSGNCTGIQLSTNNLTVDPVATWPRYVFLTPWGPSSCATLAGGQCTIFENACYGGNTGVLASAASDYYCPMISGQTSPPTLYFGLQDLFSPPNPPVAITPGMTASLLDFTPSSPSEIWAPIPSPISSSSTANPVCTNPFGTSASSPAFQCDVIDTLVEMYGDQTTTRGKSPKSKGWIATALNVPMLWTAWDFIAGGSGCPTPPAITSPFQLNTQPGIANNPPVTTSDPSSSVWFNMNCLVQFTVNPATVASPPSPNNFVAAPPASISYGVEASSAPIPVIPLPGDTPQTNSNIGYPATAWTYPASSITSLLGITSDGTYTLHWSAEDLVGNSEKSVVLLTLANDPAGNIPCLNPQGDESIPPAPTSTQSCYTSSLFTLALNIDSTQPNNVAYSFSPPGSPAGSFYAGQTVYPVYTCSDQINNNVASGIANCGGVIVPPVGGSCPTSTMQQGPALNTSNTTSNTIPYSYQVTATDCAGNISSTPVTVSYQVMPGLTISPASWVYGTLAGIGQSVSQTFTLTNNTTKPITNLKVSIPTSNESKSQPAGDPDDFTITAKTCKTTLGAAGTSTATCTVTVRFKSDLDDLGLPAPGNYTYLTVTDSAGGSPQTAYINVTVVK